MSHIQKLENDLSEYRNILINHKLYSNLDSKEKLVKFMENHVFAVWDFMSLIKALQNNLTCVEVPWTPNKNNLAGRLVNDIVLAEESDIDLNGNTKSHFELYLDSMSQIGASTDLINSFILKIIESKSYSKSVNEIDINKAVKNFMDFTFDIIATNKNHVIASVFTFGREDLIPDMFTAIVNEYNKENKLDKFVYYLERHIELDGGDHGPLALELICSLCGDDEQKWREVEETAILCLKARKKLWDLILENIN